MTESRDSPSLSPFQLPISLPLGTRARPDRTFSPSVPISLLPSAPSPRAPRLPSSSHVTIGPPGPALCHVTSIRLLRDHGPTGPAGPRAAERTAAGPSPQQARTARRAVGPCGARPTEGSACRGGGGTATGPSQNYASQIDTGQIDTGQIDTDQIYACQIVTGQINAGNIVWSSVCLHVT